MNHSRKQKGYPIASRKTDKLKTLCTLDTNDINFGEDENTDQNCRDKKKSVIKNLKKSKLKSSIDGCNRQHQRSQMSMSIHKQRQTLSPATPKHKNFRRSTICKKSSGTYSRFKTDYSNLSTTFHPIDLKQVRRKIIYPMDAAYHIDSYEILRVIEERSGQKRTLAKERGGRKVIIANGKECERESKLWRDVLKGWSDKKRKGFMEVLKSYKDKKVQTTIYVDGGVEMDWNNNWHCLLLTKLKSPQPQLLNIFIKHLSTQIGYLSSSGVVHGGLSLSSLYLHYLPTLSDTKLIHNLKLGGLDRWWLLKDRKGLAQMTHSYRTPPQIINYIMFQSGEKEFDREYLESITQLSHPYQIDMWSLGILILEILNGSPLRHEVQLHLPSLLAFQRQLQIKAQYLLGRFQEDVKIVVMAMLNERPEMRPDPKQINRIL